jgi:hypothetical protein
MAKIGPKDEKPFNPISEKTIAAVSSPVRSGDEAGVRPARRGNGRGRSGVIETQSFPTTETFSEAASQKLLRTKRFKVSDAEEMDIDRAVSRLAGTIRAKVNFSHISRVLWQLYLAHEDEILDRARKHCKQLARPHNGDAQALAAFEEELVRAITQAVVNAPQR